MSLLDYTPTGAFINAISGGGGSDEEGSFIDEATGQEISGAYWACGNCNHVPIREGDGSCPSCGDSVDWDPNNPEHQAQ